MTASRETADGAAGALKFLSIGMVPFFMGHLTVVALLVNLSFGTPNHQRNSNCE